MLQRGQPPLIPTGIAAEDRKQEKMERLIPDDSRALLPLPPPEQPRAAQ
jgi:hypothetical protein